jgi:hypothetical protein
MDPARMFKESLTSRPELENSQGQKGRFRSAPMAGFIGKRNCTEHGLHVGYRSKREDLT